MTELKQVALCPQSPPWVRKYNAETNRTFVFLLIFGLNCKLSVTPQDKKSRQESLSSFMEIIASVLR